LHSICYLLYLLGPEIGKVRIQALSLIDIGNIVVKEDLIEIKTYRLGLKQSLMVLLLYKEDSNTCPARTLQLYLRKTEKFREMSKSSFHSKNHSRKFRFRS